MVRSQKSLYKDTYLSTQKYPDFMMRPNALIAMALAPELFDPVKAIKFLNLCEKLLIVPPQNIINPEQLGVSLLDPFD